MKLLRILFIALLTFVVLLCVNQYFFCPRFDFPKPAPFSGNIIYNPYQSMDSAGWVKCNFHAHAKVWNGITNGHGTALDVHQAYEALNYGIHCVSNYQTIDTTNCVDSSYIPAYEHGYNIQKTHQLVLGDHSVEWLDYLLPQTRHNKQDVLNHLKNLNSLIILNHPALRGGYRVDDLSALTNYDCMEVLNPSIFSTEQWDAALSAGHKVFIVGDDDLHNVIEKDRLGMVCTFVNVLKSNKQLVLKALKSGESYGVVIGPNQQVDSIPYLKAFYVDGNSVTVEMSKRAQNATVTGQDGRKIQSFENRSKITFILRQNDHYGRVTFTYENGTQVFLNPVFFTSGLDRIFPVARENFLITMLFRGMGVIILFLYLFVIGKVFNLRNVPGYSSSPSLK